MNFESFVKDGVNWEYDRTNDNLARFTLGYVGERTLLCLGMNPSTATPVMLDATVARVKKIALRHGYDGFVMLNIYPLRSTLPKELPLACDDILHSVNLQRIENILQKLGQSDVLLAYGAIVEVRPYLITCLRDVLVLALSYGCNFKAIGKTSKKGHPHHPLYLANTEVMFDFDIGGYTSIYKENICDIMLS